MIHREKLVHSRTTASSRHYLCPNCKEEISVYNATAACSKCGAEYDIEKADEYDFNGIIYLVEIKETP